MRAEVKKCAEVQEYPTPERCAILEVANDIGDPSVSIARARVSPGTRTVRHRLTDTDERYLIIAGRATVEIGDLPPTQVDVGDVVRIPAGTAQRITNIGREDLLFYAICSPRFKAESYESLE